jgi:2-hydroxychromene-2-carboxylate isomerase
MRLYTRIYPYVNRRSRMRNTEQSVLRGTFGSPTFFVGEEIFSGKDRLREVEEAILSSRRSSDS